MISAIDCLELNIRPYLDHYIEIIQLWITNSFQITTVKNQSWLILTTLIDLFGECEEIMALVNLFFDDFNSMLTATTDIDTGFEIIQSLAIVLKGLKVPWFDSDRISESLVKLDEYLTQILGELKEIIESNDRFFCEHDSKDEGRYDHLLGILNSF